MNSSVDRFVLTEQISSEGPISYHKGLVNETGQEVIIKQVLLEGNDSHLEAAQREAAILQHLSNQFIIPLYSTAQSQQKFYFVFQPCPGQTLAQYISNWQGPIPDIMIKSWINQLLSALTAMNDEHIVMLSLSSAAVLLTQSHDIQIYELSSARNFTQPITIDSISINSSPEVVSQTGDYRKAAVWGLGILLFEMITKRHPFNVKSEEALHEAHRSLIDFTNCDVSPAAQALILDLLELDPNARPELREISDHIFLCDIPQATIDIDQGSIGMNAWLQDVTETDIKTLALQYSESNPGIAADILARRLAQIRSKRQKCNNSMTGRSHPLITRELRELERNEQEIHDIISTLPQTSNLHPDNSMLLQEVDRLLVKAIRTQCVEEGNEYARHAEILLHIGDCDRLEVSRGNICRELRRRWSQ